MSYVNHETPTESLIRRHNLVQTDLAEEVGISQPYLSQIAAGLRVPSVPVAQRLASALRSRTGEDVTVEHLFPLGDLPAAANE